MQNCVPNFFGINPFFRSEPPPEPEPKAEKEARAAEIRRLRLLFAKLIFSSAVCREHEEKDTTVELFENLSHCYGEAAVVQPVVAEPVEVQPVLVLPVVVYLV